jgi:hypothetical protein
MPAASRLPLPPEAEVSAWRSIAVSNASPPGNAMFVILKPTVPIGTFAILAISSL